MLCFRDNRPERQSMLLEQLVGERLQHHPCNVLIIKSADKRRCLKCDSWPWSLRERRVTSQALASPAQTGLPFQKKARLLWIITWRVWARAQSSLSYLLASTQTAQPSSYLLCHMRLLQALSLMPAGAAHSAGPESELG